MQKQLVKNLMIYFLSGILVLSIAHQINMKVGPSSSFVVLTGALYAMVVNYFVRFTQPTVPQCHHSH